jgi:hypothetical protein
MLKENQLPAATAAKSASSIFGRSTICVSRLSRSAERHSQKVGPPIPGMAMRLGITASLLSAGGVLPAVMAGLV